MQKRFYKAVVCGEKCFSHVSTESTTSECAYYILFLYIRDHIVVQCARDHLTSPQCAKSTFFCFLGEKKASNSKKREREKKRTLWSEREFCFAHTINRYLCSFSCIFAVTVVGRCCSFFLDLFVFFHSSDVRVLSGMHSVCHIRKTLRCSKIHLIVLSDKHVAVLRLLFYFTPFPKEKGTDKFLQAKTANAISKTNMKQKKEQIASKI